MTELPRPIIEVPPELAELRHSIDNIDAAVLDLLAAGQLPQQGFIRQEDIPLKVFLDNRFGRVYAKPETGTSRL